MQKCSSAYLLGNDGSSTVACCETLRSAHAQKGVRYSSKVTYESVTTPNHR